MKKIIFICAILSILVSCKNSSNESGLKLKVVINDKLDRNKFSYVKGAENGEFYPISIDFYNYSDTACEMITMSCTWQENYIFNSKDAFLLTDSLCINDFPHPMLIPSNQISKNSGIVWLNDSLKASQKKLKLGFIVIRKKDILFNNKFENVLQNKIKSGKDIIWSESIEFNNE